MSGKLLTEHHLEFLSLKGGCTGSSKSTLVKMPHCWKSHVAAHIYSVLQEEHGKSERKYLDFLDILLTAKDENGVGLTPIEIRNEVDTFLFEGRLTYFGLFNFLCPLY